MAKYDLALLDLILPYVFRGDNFGQWHAALSTLYVSEYSISTDDSGVVIRGLARFSGQATPIIDPQKMTFSVSAENTEGHPASDPGRRDPWLEIRHAHVDFELTAHRVATSKLQNPQSPPLSKPDLAVLSAYNGNAPQPPAPPAPSDWPSTDFTLDLVLSGIALRLPFLRGAKLQDFQLVADPTRADVIFNLPRVKLRLGQGSNPNDALTAQFSSLGASGLDDQNGMSVAELISMDPPYAFIGPSDCVGFGFRSATLDLGSSTTPPDILSQFGYDESWTGLYLPEVRLFVAPKGARDLAFNGGAKNLLIGFGASAGITGDFDLAVFDQGGGPLALNARFYDQTGACLAITRTSSTTGTIALPEQTRMVVDVDGGLTPYSVTIKLDNQAEQATRLLDVDLSAQPTRTILITAKGSEANAVPTVLTITANKRLPILQGADPSPGTTPASVNTTKILKGGSPSSTPHFKLVSETDATAIVALDDGSTATWTVNGTQKPEPSTTITVDVAPGENIAIEATITPSQPKSDPTFTGFYRFDRPPLADDKAVEAFALQVDNTHDVAAPDEGPQAKWPAGNDAGTDLALTIGALPDTPATNQQPDGMKVTIKGYASFEKGGANAHEYNRKLAERRAQGLKAIIEDRRSKLKPLSKYSYSVSADMENWENQGGKAEERKNFWKAVVTFEAPAIASPSTTVDGTVSRPPKKPITPPIHDDPQELAKAPPPPSWFKAIGAKVRIVRDQFVACEVFGKFDIQTAAESQLQTQGTTSPKLTKLGDNPADGIIDLRLVVQIDEATDIVNVSGYFGADPADRDGLMMSGAVPGNKVDDNDPDLTPRNILGTAILFTPFASGAVDALANSGAFADLAGDAVLGLGAAIGAADILRVQRVVWYGGEVDLQVRPDGTQLLILLDLETAISADFKLVEIPEEAPLVVRYKAVGLRIGSAPGDPRFQFRPFFDSSKGYTIDIARPGAVRVADPLGQILKILGARVARNNPTIFEIDLGFAVDLGVVSVDRARVRVPIHEFGPPQLTAFSASADVGALKGHGYLEINDNEIAGGLDLTIVPVQVRVAAEVAVAHIPQDDGSSATGVAVSLEVDLPVAIPLGCSGLGIYGFLGLFAVNYARNESDFTNSATPALEWLKWTGGKPTHLKNGNANYWVPKLNSWAFGVGAILGSMGSSVIFNLKGVFLLELPGPRLLLMMKAKLLAEMPALKGDAEGLFFAVIDLDFGRGTLTIGLSIDFDVHPLLKLHIPSEAFFNFHDLSDWHLYLGTDAIPVEAMVLDAFDASGYLMLSGNGLKLSDKTHLPEVHGFAIAMGLHVSFTWGNPDFGLYADLAAGFDAIVGFSPFRLAGNMMVRGSLHLFIIDIDAFAQLSVDVGTKQLPDGTEDKIARISGEICGRVHFLFFTLEGCLSFSLGDDSPPAILIPPLVSGLKLVSRSPALVVGSGVDRGIDTSLCDAKQSDTWPANVDVEDPAGEGTYKFVPLDAIPVLMMSAPPMQASGLKFGANDLGGTPDVPADGFVRRGDIAYAYTLNSVELIGHPSIDSAIVGDVTDGQTPATWWKSKSGETALEAQLALLSWLPEPAPKAIVSSTFLEESASEQWGTVCQPAAPAAFVLWTFLDQLLGPSNQGWNLQGTALPDPPNTVRSSPPDVKLKVTERWRCGNPSIDEQRGIVAARVEGAFVACPPPATTTTSLIPLSVSAPQRVRPLGPTELLSGDPREALVRGETLTLGDTLARFGRGQPVARSTMSRMTLSATTPPTGGGCFAKALAAPMFDEGKVVAFGPAARAANVTAAWKELGYRVGALDNAVVFETGPVAMARFLMWVPLSLLDQQALVVWMSNAADQALSVHVVSGADRVPPAQLPPQWTDATSPFRDSVQLVTALQATQQQYALVVVTMVGVSGADRVQIGVLPKGRGQPRSMRPFYVGAVELLRKSEIARSDYDAKQQQKKKGVLQQVLSNDIDDYALLKKNQVYEVRTTWSANAVSSQPGLSTQKTLVPQSFWFKTDPNPPARLDPWVMVALPADGERHVFTSEAIRVVFATPNVIRLYAAYGMQLEATLRSSSFKQIESTDDLPHPLVLRSPDPKSSSKAPTVQPVKATVLSPWEEAVQKVAGPCISVSGERTRHSMITMPYPLDPHTDYVLDIDMVDKNDPASRKRVWRTRFSSGGFPSVEEFALSFQAARVEHRGIPNAASLQAVGTYFSKHGPAQGSVFDQKLMEAGLDALPVPKSPRLVVFWDDAATPQPVAVLVDASEPMWRERPIPTEVVDPADAAAKRWELLPAPWLELKQGGDLASGIIDQIVPAPGGQRALVTLKPNSRGKHLSLVLNKIPHTQPYLDGPSATAQQYVVLDEDLMSAPWEEND